MKYFALMVDGQVAEVIPEYLDVELPGEDAPTIKKVGISDRYHPDFIAKLVPFDPKNPPKPPAPQPARIPTSVTMRQARLALLDAGKYADVQAAIGAADGPEGEAARIEWEFATTVERDSPIVAMLAKAVKLKAADLDALFTKAATL